MQGHGRLDLAARDRERGLDDPGDAGRRLEVAEVGLHGAQEARRGAARRAPVDRRESADLDRIEVAPKRARELRAWCATLAGWDPAAPPLSFVGLIGRPPSPRRSAGARRLQVRLAPYEFALLDPLASTRGQSLADLLLTSAVVEARREEARATDDGEGDEMHAEVVALDAIEVGDILYTDLRCLPRGHAERVTAVQREHNLWRIELASGPPAWFGNGARVWRKRKRVRT